MKKMFLIATLAFVGFAFVSAHAAPAVKTYQVTGPVVEVTSDKIVVMKGKDKWEIARGSANVPDTVKAGSKVTIEYTMTAVTVSAKDAKVAAPAKAAVPAKKK